MNQNLIFRTVQKGFTLVELLIVVIILSILAAIALPQFSSSTEDANLASLNTTLGNMRSVIDLYAQQHGGDYPGEVTAGGTGCNTGPAPLTAGGDTLETFMEQMTRYSNAAGETCSVSDNEFRFGPYLKKDTFPANPVTSNDIIEFVDSAAAGGGALGMLGTGPAGGWKYDVRTGQFIANDTDFIDGSAVPAFDTL